MIDKGCLGLEVDGDGTVDLFPGGQRPNVIAVSESATA